MKSYTLYIIIYSFIFLCPTFASAQPIINTTVNKTKIKIGEPIIVRLSARWPDRPIFTSSFIVPDSIVHFEIWEKSQQTAIKNGIEQQLTLTSFDSGLHVIPSFPLKMPANNDSAILDYHTDSIPITVMPVKVDSLQDYHDIKDIIEVPSAPQWPYITAIAIITLVSLIILHILIQKRRVSKKMHPAFLQNGDPYENALQALKKLEADITNLPSKWFFTQLVDIYRNYIRDKYNFYSHQQTGDKLILHVKSFLNQDSFFQFASTIRMSDMAKFAKYEPVADEWKNSIQIIRQTINILEKISTQILTNKNPVPNK